jgi:hypothetical protein
MKPDKPSEDSAQNPDESSTLHLEKFIPNQPPGPPPDPAHDTLTSFVCQAAQQTCAHPPQPVVAPKENNALSGPSLLGVVSYCYAKDVCSSAEIESKLAKDPAIRAACGTEVPDRRILRRFRRLNRAALEVMLEKIFRYRRRKEKAALLAATGTPPVSSDQPGESTILFAKHEAQARIEKAIFVDEMEEDD